MENILLEFAGTLVNNKELSTSYSEFLYCNFCILTLTSTE